MQYINFIIEVFILFFGYFLWKKQESYKNTLNKEIENFKHYLGKILYEHQVKFSKLHEKRAEVIEKLYKILVDFHVWLKNTLILQNGSSSHGFKFQEKAGDKLRDFENSFKHNRIYFSENLCNKISHLIEKSWETLIKQSFEELSQDDIEEIFKTIEFDLEELKKDIESEFRTLLGVSNNIP